MQATNILAYLFSSLVFKGSNIALTIEVNTVKRYYSSLTNRQNKIECLSLSSLSSLVEYLRVRQGSTRRYSLLGLDPIALRIKIRPKASIIKLTFS
jgi:hypothetical protein